MKNYHYDDSANKHYTFPICLKCLQIKTKRMNGTMRIQPHHRHKIWWTVAVVLWRNSNCQKWTSLHDYYKVMAACLSVCQMHQLRWYQHQWSFPHQKAPSLHQKVPSLPLQKGQLFHHRRLLSHHQRQWTHHQHRRLLLLLQLLQRPSQPHVQSTQFVLR